jgi:hypothetical protein
VPSEKCSIVFSDLMRGDLRRVPYKLHDGRTDGQTDIANLIVTFLNFVNAPKNGCKYYINTNPKIF